MNKNDLIYINMCSASPLVQRHWKPAKGDYVFLREENCIELLTEKQNKKDKFWLLTEFQLQKLGVKYGVFNWIKFDQECVQHWNEVIAPTSEMKNYRTYKQLQCNPA